MSTEPPTFLAKCQLKQNKKLSQPVEHPYAILLLYFATRTNHWCAFTRSKRQVENPTYWIAAKTFTAPAQLIATPRPCFKMYARLKIFAQKVQSIFLSRVTKLLISILFQVQANWPIYPGLGMIGSHYLE